jgi:enoyl-CoA hydratase/carnithine racemase
MTWTTLQFEREGSIGTVWLDRPERRNALNQTALEEIADLFTSLSREFDLRVVILGGRGPSFSAGADLKDPPGVARMGDSAASVRERRWLSDLGTRAIEAIERLDAITIARVHGHAIGGGALLALACDLRIVAAGTQFGIPEVGLGDVLNWKGVPRLVAEVGLVRAREIVLLGDRFDAAEAERIGLINRMVPPEELDRLVADWAARIAAKPDTALALSKAQFRSLAALAAIGDTQPFESAFELEALRDEQTRARFGIPIAPPEVR